MPTVPLLASVADLNASVTSGGASQLVPSGVVMAFAGATAPTGWLLCGGALINRTTYADLFAAIGTAHGSGDGSTTFALPNYAGRFLRGRANGSANDPDRASRTAPLAGGNSGDNVGSVQGNATARPNTNFTSGNMSANASHGHTGLVASGTTPVYVSFNGGPSNNTGRRYLDTGTQTAGYIEDFGIKSQSTEHTHTITTGGDNETRPLNAYVNYIIKV